MFDNVSIGCCSFNSTESEVAIFRGRSVKICYNYIVETTVLLLFSAIRSSKTFREFERLLFWNPTWADLIILHVQNFLPSSSYSYLIKFKISSPVGLEPTTSELHLRPLEVRRAIHCATETTVAVLCSVVSYGCNYNIGWYCEITAKNTWNSRWRLVNQNAYIYKISANFQRLAQVLEIHESKWAILDNVQGRRDNIYFCCLRDE